MSEEEYDSLFEQPSMSETSMSGDFTEIEEHIGSMLLGSLRAYIESEDGDFIAEDLGRMPTDGEMMSGRRYAYEKLEAWLNSIGA